MLLKLRQTSPALKALLFSLIPLAYYLADKLNYSQAGKAAVLGFLSFGTLFYWREISTQRRKLFTTLLTVFLFVMTLYMAFQATLRDVFSVQQEDTIVIQSIFSTDTNEAGEFFIQYAHFIVIHFAVFVLSFSLYWFLFVRQTAFADYTPSQRKRHLWLATLFTFFLVAIHFNPTARRYNPFIYFPYNYIKWQDEVAMAAELQDKLAKNNEDPQLNSMKLRDNTDPRTVVFVIGESDTRNNWSLYGYGRETNPQLSKLQSELTVFKDVLSGDDGTIKSITKMLTPATLQEPELWKSKPSFVTIAKRLGYKVIWITNQGTEGQGVVSMLASQADQTVFTNRGRSRGEGSVDDVVLTPYDAALADPAAKKLIVVHILGGHPAYNFRYPEGAGHFEDVFDDDIARSLREQERAPWAIAFRNMYDSAVRYQDHVLSQLLLRLKQRNEPNSAWLYIPDHGQDVAHNSNFSGHNGKVKEMWEVPMLFWAGENFSYPPISSEELANRRYQADVIDHTLLGLMGIEGDYYDARFDILSSRYDAQLFASRNLRGLNYDRDSN